MLCVYLILSEALYVKQIKTEMCFVGLFPYFSIQRALKELYGTTNPFEDMF